MSERLGDYSGIYLIICLPTGRYYIGSSQTLFHRWRTHERLLQRGEHHNAALQQDWNNLGSTAFVFGIVEFVKISELENRERAMWQRIYDVVDSSKIYNAKTPAAKRISFACPFCGGYVRDMSQLERVQKYGHCHRCRKR